MLNNPKLSKSRGKLAQQWQDIKWTKTSTTTIQAVKDKKTQDAQDSKHKNQAKLRGGGTKQSKSRGPKKAGGGLGGR